MSGLLLASRTPASWAPSVAGDVGALLSDHAHCELKAAASAMTLLRRHGARAGLVARLTPLVREELDHFQRVLRELAAYDALVKAAEEWARTTAAERPAEEQPVDPDFVRRLKEIGYTGEDQKK